MEPMISRRQSLKNRMGLVLATIILLLIVLPVVHILASHRTDIPLIWGDRSEAMFDLWSIQHFCSGILIGSLLVSVRVASQATGPKFVLLTLVIALSWEAIELAMESGLFGQVVANWKHGFEHWGNRFIGDPLMVILGSLLARKCNNAWKWVLAPASVWLIANVASPNSMSIQRFLLP